MISSDRPDINGIDYKFPVIETKRLALREIIDADSEDLFAIHGDANLMKWFGVDPLKDIEGAKALIALFGSWRKSPNPGTRWGIQLKDRSNLIGTCGLFAWNRDWKKCAIGFELASKFHGQGIMREALAAIICWGFANMDLNRIEAQIHPDNLASLGLISRLGFVQEGRLRQAGYWGGRFNDLLMHSLLREEWVLLGNDSDEFKAIRCKDP